MCIWCHLFYYVTTSKVLFNLHLNIKYLNKMVYYHNHTSVYSWLLEMSASGSVVWWCRTATEPDAWTGNPAPSPTISAV